MKEKLKGIIVRILIFLAKIRLWRLGYKSNPKHSKVKIIGITGSVGKTSTKDILAYSLKGFAKIGTSEGSLNTEIGLPLTILGQKSGYSSISAWIIIIIKSFFISIFGPSKDIYVLEYGVDAPGDMDLLLSIVKPHIGIITEITSNHIDEGQFKSIQDIFNEKKKLALNTSGCVILNSQNKYLVSLAKQIKKKVILYNHKTLFANNIQQTLNGMKFNINYKKDKHEIFSKIIGEHHVSLFLIVFAVCNYLGLDMKNIYKNLSKFELPNGRLTLLDGINDSTILDSTYNASEFSIKSTIDTVQQVPAKRKILALGNMNELGVHASKIHEKVGYYAGKHYNIAFFCLVGVNSKDYKKGLLKAGVSSKNIHIFNNSLQCGDYLQLHLRPGDLVLLKGSQNKVRMEKAVKKILKFPDRDKIKLVRQGKHWD